MEDDINEQLDDLGKQLNGKKMTKGIKVTIIVFVAIIILLIGGLIFVFIYMTNKLNEEKRIQEEKNKQNQKKKEEDHLLEINGFKEEWYDIYGDRFINLSYSEGNIIPNTFKKGKPNYIEELGDINEGKDYDKYDTNVYDLYIPYSSYKRKQKHNGIMLFVRGGGFENNTKEEVECFAIRFAKLGFITANIEYTNSLDKYKQKGFFRILDEMTACIKSIKKELGTKGFDEDKLELSLYGISAGGQLILLYSFTDKNKILPIKFILNSVGVTTIDPKYWYVPAVPNVTLDSIETIEDIKEGIEKKIIVRDKPFFVLYMTNLMTGKKLTLDEINKLIINDEVNKEDPKYQEMYKYAKYGSPLELIGNFTLPMLCLYDGNDGLVAHYSNLHQHYIDKGVEQNIELVYMKYAGHERFHHGSPHDIEAMKKMHSRMVDYAKTYFTQD